MEIEKRIKNALRIAEGIKKGKIDSKNLYDLLLHLSEANIQLENKQVKEVKELFINDLFLKAISHGYLHRDDFDKPGYDNWNKTTMKFFEKHKENLDKIGWNSKRFLKNNEEETRCEHCGGSVAEEPWDLCKGCEEVLM